jgi:hypothetical protein
VRVYAHRCLYSTTLSNPQLCPKRNCQKSHTLAAVGLPRAPIFISKYYFLLRTRAPWETANSRARARQRQDEPNHPVPKNKTVAQRMMSHSQNTEETSLEVPQANIGHWHQVNDSNRSWPEAQNFPKIHVPISQKANAPPKC